MHIVSRSLELRGLRFHVSEWGDANKPLLVLLHGWMDCSASFQRVAEYLTDDFYVVAPDLRGFGKTEHASEGYWFADYFADLECLLAHYAPDRPANLVGHSMGGNICMLYAGIHPHRVRRVMSLEALGLPPSDPSDAPEKYRRWIRQTLSQQEPRVYPSFDAFCNSIHRSNPRLSPEVVVELVECWGEQLDDYGAYRLRHDYRHKHASPIRYNFEDTKAVWKEITAKVGLVMAEHSDYYQSCERGGRIDEARNLLGVDDDSYFVVKDAAHMLHLEQAQMTADCIARFFKASV